jgi:hypothetical protein
MARLHKAVFLVISALAIVGSPAFATTIVATPTASINLPPFQFFPSFTVTFTDLNNDGLFEINELDSFSANPTISGSGGGIYQTVYTSLFSTPTVTGVSSSSVLTPNPAPSNNTCATGWCMSTLTYHIASTDPTVLSGFSHFSVSDYTYAVSPTVPVPEPSTYLLTLFGVALVASRGRSERARIRHLTRRSSR